MNLLQRIRFPESSDVSQLYFRLSGRAELPLRRGEARVTMKQGSTLSLDTYFNSIYLKTWAAHTHLRSLYYQLRLRGTIIVRVYHDRSFRPRELLSETRIEMPVAGQVDVRLPGIAGPSADAGRLYLELHAVEDGEFFGGSVVTDQKPAREVALGLISVTYKNEALIHALIDRWASDDALRNKNTVFFVIDNGATLKPSEFTDSRLRIVANRNSGGSGGFNRGFLEAAAHGGLTHYLLMDDDAVIDAESILRLVTFYEYSSDDSAVAGAMLDLSDRTILYQTGSVWGGIRSGRNNSIFSIRRFHTTIRLDRPGSLNTLSDEPGRGDCSGFYFFGFPAEWIDRSGFLMPFFIHGDDIEFCFRQQAASGQSIIHIPSLGAWHHTWTQMEYRQPPRLAYYDIRNSVIIYFLHANISAWKLMLGMTRKFIRPLFTFDYERAALILLGVRHALAGPRFLAETDPADLNEKLPELYARLNDCRPAAVSLSPKAVKDIFKRHRRPLWKGLAQIASLNGHLLPDFFLKQKAVFFAEGGWHRVFGFKRAVLAKDGLDLFECRMRRRTCASLIGQWLGICCQLLIRGARLRKDWRDAHGSLTEPGFVRKFTNSRAAAPPDLLPR